MQSDTQKERRESSDQEVYWNAIRHSVISVISDISATVISDSMITMVDG